MTAPTLADDLRVGDKLQVTPVWQTADGHAPPPPQPGVVEYIHPAGRYCIVRLPNGITETVQTIPADMVAHREDLPEGYHTQSNRDLRQLCRDLHVRQTDVSVELGYGPTWLSRQLDKDLTDLERKQIIRAAHRVAERRLQHDPV